MKKLFLLTSLFSMCLLIFSCDTGTKTEEAEEETVFDDELGEEEPALNIEEETNKFMVNAASSSQIAVQLGQIASDKAQNQKVKEYGQMAAEEHKKVNDELQNIALEMNLRIPQEPKEEHREKVKELQNTSGKEFDKKYLDMVQELHEKDIDKFEDMQGDIQNQELKTWVEQTLPKLKDHKQRAEQIKEDIK